MLGRVFNYLRGNHLAVIALCVAVVGTPAAWAIGHNSVGSKQIKNGGVKSADVADDSLTGKDILESSLAQVPSAKSAATASSATSVGGVKESPFSFDTTSGESKSVQQNGVKIDVSCNEFNGQGTLGLTPTANGNLVKATWVSPGSGTATAFAEESRSVLDTITITSNAFPSGQGTFTVRSANHLAYYDFTVVSDSSGAFDPSDECFVYGFVRVANL
jgi:hypothetical protein